MPRPIGERRGPRWWLAVAAPRVLDGSAYRAVCAVFPCAHASGLSPRNWPRRARRSQADPARRRRDRNRRRPGQHESSGRTRANSTSDCPRRARRPDASTDRGTTASDMVGHDVGRTSRAGNDSTDPQKRALGPPAQGRYLSTGSAPLTTVSDLGCCLSAPHFEARWAVRWSAVRNGMETQSIPPTLPPT